MSWKLIIALILSVCVYNLFPFTQTFILSSIILYLIILLFSIILKKNSNEIMPPETNEAFCAPVPPSETAWNPSRDKVTVNQEWKLSFPKRLPIKEAFFIETFDRKRVFYENGVPVEVYALDYVTPNKEIRQKEELRAAQCDSFTIEDMYQFSDIPFKWHFVMQLSHSKGIPWFMLNMNNQQVAMPYIWEISQLIIDAREKIPNIADFDILAHNIDYDFPYPMQKDSIMNTCVMCYPYTPTGRVSKYPVILRFSTTQMFDLENVGLLQAVFCRGHIKILQNGKIGMAYVLFAKNHTNFKFSLENDELIIKRIDSSNGNIYKHPCL